MVSRKILSIFITFLFIACTKESEIQREGFASNRQMGFAIRKAPADLALRSQLQKLSLEGIEKSYANKARLLSLGESASPLVESPENLYQISYNLIDDLFILDIEAGEMATPAQSMKATYSIYNGAELKTVTLFSFTLDSTDKNSPIFEEEYVKRFKIAALENFANPNIYPRSNPIHFANLLYQFSEGLEKESPALLTCENAAPILKSYKYSSDLYRLAKERGLISILGQESAHDINQRFEDASKKADIVIACQKDAESVFKMDVNYGNLDLQNKPFVEKALLNAEMEKTLRQYTKKPVFISFQVGANGDLGMSVVLSFNLDQYKAWTQKRIPLQYKEFHVLSLDPYYALMQKMILLKVLIPNEAPSNLKSSFANMSMSLTLNTLLNGSATVGVQGSYLANQKKVQMAYPNSVIIQAPGYEAKTIFNKSQELFQEKGFIALSSCKTLDGSTTEDGLVYKFFGFPCR